MFPNQDVDVEWQHKQNRGRRRGLRGELSFLVNSSVWNPGIGLTGDRVAALGKAVSFVTASVRSRRPLKTWWRDLFAPLVVLITASGLQG